MRPHPRTRKAAKWTTLALTILLLAAGAVSTVWSCGFTSYTPTGSSGAGVNGASLCVFTSTAFSTTTTQSKQKWSFTRKPDGPSLRWWPERESAPLGMMEVVWIPLWIPTLISLTLSAALFRYDTIATRRAKQNLCPTCSYDRTGLAPSSPCPECGKAIA